MQRVGLPGLCAKEVIFTSHSQIQSPDFINSGCALGICHPSKSKNTHTAKERKEGDAAGPVGSCFSLKLSWFLQAGSGVAAPSTIPGSVCWQGLIGHSWPWLQRGEMWNTHKKQGPASRERSSRNRPQFWGSASSCIQTPLSLPRKVRM